MGLFGNEDRLRVVTFKLPVWLIKKLNMVARIENTSRSVIIRKAIEEYLKRNGYL